MRASPSLRANAPAEPPRASRDPHPEAHREGAPSVASATGLPRRVLRSRRARASRARSPRQKEAHAFRALRGIQEHRRAGSVEAGLRRSARERGIRDRLRHQHRPDSEARERVKPKPAPVIPGQPPHDRGVPGNPGCQAAHGPRAYGGRTQPSLGNAADRLGFGTSPRTSSRTRLAEPASVRRGWPTEPGPVPRDGLKLRGTLSGLGRKHRPGAKHSRTNWPAS